MSEQNTLDDQQLHEQVEAVAALEKKKREVLSKELVVRERVVETKIQKIEQGDKAELIAKNTSYGAMTEAEILEAQRENSEYMLAAKSKICFINEDFDDTVPFFRKNIILLGAKTGEGKSTAVANVIISMLRHINPITKKKRKILVITNEEKVEDVYNRVTCLVKGWHYVAHNKFTDEQVEVFNNYIGLLAKDGMLTVVDDHHNGAAGTTTTLEGISRVFDNLLERKEYFDAILIDYYQNIAESRTNPIMKNWEVQELFAKRLDKFKNTYPAPIILLAQLKPGDEDNTPFKERIEGRKSILNVATCALEIVANKENRSTEWVVHKSRFNEAMGNTVVTGYDKGRFVLYNDEFRSAVERSKALRDQGSFDKRIGHISVEKEGDKNE